MSQKNLIAADENGETSVVFVYGTLRRDGTRRNILGEDDKAAQYLGEARLSQEYHMYDLGQFPAIISNPNMVGIVIGELFEIHPKLFEILDAIEGVPDLYKRTKVRLDLLSDWQHADMSKHAKQMIEDMEVFAYEFVDKKRLMQIGTLIHSGDWIDYLTASAEG